MAENSGFFASVGGDRQYTTDFLADWVKSFISNGVYNGELAVTAGDGMTVKIPAGRAWINGYYYHNDSELTLTIDNADGVLNRIDVVVLRWDVNARSITAQVIKGTPASTAAAPAITRTTEQYDLKLAEISIPAGTTAITQSLITDTRLDNDACGIVHGVVQQVDTTTLYAQIQDDLMRFRATNEADFTAWVNGLKDVLDENTAGNLLNLIENHKDDKNNPHNVTAEQIGAETPAGAQAKASTAETNAKNYADETKVSKAGDTITGILTMDGGNAINFGGKFQIAYNSATNSLDITVVG